MKINTILAAALVGALALSATFTLPAVAQQAPATIQARPPLTEAQAYEIGRAAYEFAQPLVIMEVTRRIMVSVDAPRPNGYAPVNQLGYLARFPDAKFRDIVRPNSDTLYGSVWFDLSAEPVVLEVPDMGDRFYVLQTMNMWTDVIASPGSRTTGKGKKVFAVVGPGWKGELPSAMSKIESPTAYVWLASRLKVENADDVARVRALYDQFRVTPLSAYGKPYTPPAAKAANPSWDIKTPPLLQIRNMGAATFFSITAATLGPNPPSPADAPVVAKMAQLGLTPGQPFDVAKLSPEVQRGLARAVKDGLAAVETTPDLGRAVNGWKIDTDTQPGGKGRFGTHYANRAVVALKGLAANMPEDAVYCNTSTDGALQKLDGSHRYRLHFAKGQLPPVNAFWSVTMYDQDGFFVDNPLNRYLLNDRSPLQFNADGSVDLHVQHESPGAERESNWLPAPATGFALNIRLYWPKPEVLDARWSPPAIQRVAGQPGAAVTPTEARALAQEAYIWGYTIVDEYRTMYAHHLDTGGPDYAAPLNQLGHNRDVATPANKAVQAINADTPYSRALVDLRTEPFVIGVPDIEQGRFYHVQLVDLYTHNLDYIGTRKDGNGAGNFLLVGPNWKGETLPGIKRVIRTETELVRVTFRTQVLNPGDLETVRRLQDRYSVQPLSAFRKQPTPAPAPAINFPAIDKETMYPRLFGYLNFLLQFCPVHPSEEDLRARLARIGIEPGKPFPPAGMSPEVIAAIEAGIQDGQAAVDKAAAAAGSTSSVGYLGSREQLKNNYLNRAVGCKMGINGNSPEEALYQMYQQDAGGQRLDTSEHGYTLRFAKDALPPVNAFWSVTMYDGKTLLLIENPIHRYLVNSPMMPNLERDADGGLTIYIQNKSPGKGKESNWLPAPDGPAVIALRMYLPKPEIIDGTWKPPAIEKVN